MTISALQGLTLLLGLSEVLLAGFILWLDQRRTANILLAAYLFILAVYSLGVAGMSGATTIAEAGPGLALVALTVFQTGIGLLLITVAIFRPDWLKRRWLVVAAGLIVAAPIALAAIDLLTGSRILISGLEPRFYTGGYVELSAFMNSPLATLFRLTHLLGAQLAEAGLIVYLLSRPHPRVQRSSLWLLLGITLLSLSADTLLRPTLGALVTFILVHLAISAGVLLVVFQTGQLSTRRLSAHLGWSLADNQEPDEPSARPIRTPVATKLLVLVITIVMIIVGIQTWLSIDSSQRQELTSERNRLISIYNDFTAQVNDRELNAASLAVSFADRPDLRDLFDRRDRRGLLDLLDPVFQILKTRYNVAHLYVEDASGNVFLRVHNPSQYGDNVLYRRTAAEAIQQKHPVAGVEIGPSRLSARGVAPIFDTDGFFIGLVEVGLDYDQSFIDNLKQRTGSDYRLWIANSAAAAAGLKPAADAPAPPLSELFFYASTRSSVPQAPAEAYRRVMSSGTMEVLVTRANGQEWSTLLAPIRAYPDRIIGVLEASLSREPSLLVLRSDLTTTITIAVSLALLAVALIWISTNAAVTQPLRHLSRVAARQLGGDYSARAHLTTGDEFNQLSDTLNTLTDQLQQLIGSLEQRVLARTEQLRASADVGRAAASILDTDELLTAVVNLITERFGFYYAAVFTLDDDGRRAVLRAATGEAGRVLMERQHQLEVDERSMVGAAIVRRQARITADVTREGSRFANPLLPETRSEIALPLQVGRRVLGALDVQSIELAAFDEAAAGVLQSMADQIAVALSNAQQFRQTAVALEQANTLYQASQSMALATDPQAMLADLVRYAAADADRAAIILYGPEQPGAEPHLVSVAAWARRGTDLQITPDARFTMDQLPVMRNLSAAAPLIVADSRQPDIDVNVRRTMRLFRVRAAVVMPMITGQQPFGALIIAYRQPRRFTADDLRPLTALTNQLAVSIQNQRLLAEAQSALQQLDEANRRLTGEAWRAYTRATPALRAIDVGPGVSPERVSADAAAPIVVRGEPIGVLKLGGLEGRQDWAEDNLALLQAVADEVANVIDNTRLFEQAELRAAREAQLNRIADRIRRAAGIQAILRAAAEELSAALNTSHAHAQLGRGARRNGHKHDPAVGQLDSPPLAEPEHHDHNGQEVSA